MLKVSGEGQLFVNAFGP